KVARAKHFVQISAIGADKIPESKYAVSKLAGERAVLKEFPDAVIVRPSIIFGAEDNFFNQFAKMATKSPCLPLIGGGKTKFQPVYVGDVAKAIIAIIESDKFGGNIFEIGGPDIYSFREILELICKITGRKPFFNYLPFWLAGLIGNIFELLPTKPPITSDQVKLLKHDNIVDNKFKTLSDLGIIPESVKNIVPSYLLRYRNQ
ncbi:MAG: complex I NDUFA9 subunit family protein, partial [Pseudomonadota bacterium]